MPVPLARIRTESMPSKLTGSHASQSPASNDVTLLRPLAVASPSIATPDDESAHSASCGFGFRTSCSVVVAAGTPLAPASV